MNDTATAQHLTSDALQRDGEGVEEVFGQQDATSTAFHFLARNWKTLTISFKQCAQNLVIESDGDGSPHMPSQGTEERGEGEGEVMVRCRHNQSVIVPTHLLHQMSSDALLQYCLDQERLLVGIPCEHDNSSTKLVVSIDNKRCAELCNRTLTCGHPCRKFCHENCYPCEEVVVIPNDGCDHNSTMRCGEVYTHGECKVLVRLEEAAGCGHFVSLPCHRRFKATYDEMLQACTVTCDYVGICGHECPGTCKSCNQGRFHVRCTHRCDRILVCGHRCEAACCSKYNNTDCPPCGKPCEASCEHGTCSEKCGIPCPPCMAPCLWKCRHLQCTKLCSEPCDRDMCHAACDKILGCGCPCIGYCGEPCPPICLNCDKETLRGLLITGKELEELGEGDRFILLENCKHTFEFAVMEKIMSLGTRLKTCPLCRGLIWNCRPFNARIVEQRKKVFEVKQHRYGQEQVIQALQLECYYILNVSDRREGIGDSRFNAFRMHLLNQFMDGETFLCLPIDIMKQISTLVDAYRLIEKSTGRIAKLLTEGLVAPSAHTFYMQCIELLFGWLRSRPFPLLANEGIDFLREYDRIRDLAHLITIPPPGSPTEANEDYMNALDALEDPGAYTRMVRIEFHRRFRRYWDKFCWAPTVDPSQATRIYVAQMDIAALKIDWLQVTPPQVTSTQ